MRKLFSVLLCCLSMVLLMGAGLATETADALPGEESAVTTDSSALSSYPDVDDDRDAGAIPAQLDAQQKDAVVPEYAMLINGVDAPDGVELEIRNGESYVALVPMAAALQPEISVSWDAETQMVAITAADLQMTARVGELYVQANGRYIYLPDEVQVEDGKMRLPLWAVVKIFGAELGWDGDTGMVLVNTTGQVIQSGDEYYDEQSLFWLSRVIYAESGNQPLEGMMAVGNVVLNRVANPAYPDTIQGVLAQKNQFSTYKQGRLANRNPNEASVLAAKLVLDGGEVEETEGALYFDSCAGSWASRNKQCIAVIGNHKFYR